MKEGVVVVVFEQGRFLLIRRSQSVVAGGAWCFVGGAIEPGESQAEAVRREFLEEVGGRVEPVQGVEFRAPDGSLLLHWWTALRHDAVLAPNPAEVSEAGWFTAAQALAIPSLLAGNIEFIHHWQAGLGAGVALNPGVGPAGGRAGKSGKS